MPTSMATEPGDMLLAGSQKALNSNACAESGHHDPGWVATIRGTRPATDPTRERA